MSRRVLILDQEACALDFVLRAVAAGWETRWYRFSPRKDLKDGLGFPGFQIVDDWRDSMRWVGKDGLVWTSGNFRFLTELDRYRADFGFHVWGPTVASAKLEIDRGAGMEAMQSAGIEVPPYQTFNSMQDALDFAKKSDSAWVFKPKGDADDKASTYVSRSAADLVGWMQRQLKRGVGTKSPCMLQELISGVQAEIGVSGWMGRDGFLQDKWHLAFEHKPLMADDLGPNTGEMGTICQYCESDKLAEQMLMPLEPILRTLGHTGDFAVGAMIDGKGRAVPLEFTARAGWPAAFIQAASHRGDPFQWMLDALNGRDTLKVSRDVSIGVVLAQPRFPYGNSPADVVEGNPIEGLDDVWSDFHPIGVMRARGPTMKDGKLTEGDTYETTSEYVGVMTALGGTVEQARKRAYRKIDQIHYPNAIYRTDIGCKVQKSLEKLHGHGFALEMEAE